MRFIPKIVYNGGVTLELSLPQKVWDLEDETIGGHDKSAAGIPESFLVRRGHLCIVNLRFHEADWPAVALMIEWAQDSGASFEFWFDKYDAATRYTVYLESPVIGDKVKPTREDYKPHMVQKLTLRTTNSAIRFSARAYS